MTIEFKVPAGACDTHAHVFGPFERFPLSPEAPYTPPETPFEAYLAMLDAEGFDRGVLVHASACGWDNSGTLDALARAPGRLRGIAVLPRDTSDETLARMARGGMRGLRFAHILGSNPDNEIAGRLRLADLEGFAPRLKELGWHAQLWANCSVIAENADLLRGLGVPVVIDHMGMFDAAAGVGSAAFQALLGLVRDGTCLVKLTVFRNSKSPPEFDDTRPFHDALIAANPDQLLWGSDFPFLGMKGDPAYSAPRLSRKAIEWMGDEALVQKILVDTPARLYGF